MSEPVSISIPQQVGPWAVLMTWDAGADPASGPSSIVISPDPDAEPEDTQGGLASTVLRSIDFQEAQAAFRAVRPKGTEHDVGAEEEARALRWLFDSEGISDGYLAFLAEAYVRTVSIGVKNVAGHLAELIGKRPETLRAHLKEARKRGLLTTIPGKAGGRLTDEACEITSGEYLDKVTEYLMNG
ncbi:hypothetical protein ABT084_13660 [Streptomyces sp. NPDC002138]|uniref:hypothetical protein n=1 Tax=Streptomyces sp. NPDC002138 TaxID=3154410 RepID=UPI003321D18F